MDQFLRIESIRKNLLHSTDKIIVTDLGTGARKKVESRRVSRIARAALHRPKNARLLYRIATYFNAKKIVELGTSFGLTTMYLASVDKNAEVVTVEGCPNISDIARAHFEKAGIKNIQLINNDIEKAADTIREIFDVTDLVFFDGNHEMNATLKYFEIFLNFKHDNTVFVFDDIHWSEGMEQAWGKIQKHPDVTVTIDLFQFGLVFFRKELSKEDFLIRF